MKTESCFIIFSIIHHSQHKLVVCHSREEVSKLEVTKVIEKKNGSDENIVINCQLINLSDVFV